MPIPVEHHTPYSNLPRDQCDRVDGLVSTADKRFLRSINPVLGATDFMVATIVHGIVQECKANGITYYSHDNVLALHRIIRHRAAARLTSPGLQQDGPGGAAAVHSTGQGIADKSPDFRQSPAPGVGGRGGADEPKPKGQKRPIKIREDVSR